MSLASRLPFRHAYAAGFPGLGSQAVPTDADALDYLDRMAAADGASVEVGVATAVDAFFRDTKAAGVFDALKASCILCGARTLAGALVPVVGTAPTNVADGFVEGDYSRTAGLTGDGATTYLDTGRAQNADPQNSFHMAVFGDGGTLGYETSETGVSYLTPGFSRNRKNSGQTWGVLPSANTFFAHTRSASDSYSVRVNNDFLSPYAVVSETPSSQNTLTHRIAASYYSDTIAFYSIGTSLSLEDLDTAVTNLITAIGEAL